MARRRDLLVAGHIFDVVVALQLLVGSTGFGRNALFYSLVFLHALAALAGFGSIGFAGTYASHAYLPDDRPSTGDPQPGNLPSVPASPAVQPAGAVQGSSATVGQGEASPADVGPADVGQAEVGQGEVGQGEVSPAEVGSQEMGSPDVGPPEAGPPEGGAAVPDYETALLKYQAALREFETSEPEAELSGTEVSGTVGEGDAGQANEVSGPVEEVVVAEVVVSAGPGTSSAGPGTSSAGLGTSSAGPSNEELERDSESEELRRYFAHPARLWGFLVLVPFLGAGALAAQPNGKGFDQPWVFGALAVWLAATLVAGSLVVPSLHQMQVVLLRSDNPGASPAARSSLAVRFARAGRIASRSAAFCDVLFLVALALMIFQP